MKKIIGTILALSITSSSIFAFADDVSYYNATAEYQQVNSQIRYGDYLGAIQNCEQTIAWHTLSPEDIAIFTQLKEKANERYTSYVNGTLSFYNAYDDIQKIKNETRYYVSKDDIELIDELLQKDLSPEDFVIVENLKYKAMCRYTNNCYDASYELNTCLSYLKSGRYNDAKNICNSVLQRNDISYDDESKFTYLIERANGDINASRSGGRISANRAIQIIRSRYSSYILNYHGLKFNVYDLGDCYAVTSKVTRNANGVDYYMVFDDGSYNYLESGSDLSLEQLGLI